MTRIYTADGDVLDEICWKHYGREDAVPAVLRANPGLAAQPPILTAGIVIELPDLAPAAATEAPAVRLWDVAPATAALPVPHVPDAALTYGGVALTYGGVALTVGEAE